MNLRGFFLKFTILPTQPFLQLGTKDYEKPLKYTLRNTPSTVLSYNISKALRDSIFYFSSLF